MTIPAFASSDPDPDSQLPWPRKASAREPQEPPTAESTQPEEVAPRSDANGASPSNEPGKRRLSTWNLFTLSIAMAGSQIAWTVELG
jgi:solute carrier family 45 protein 1/2/4